MSKRPIQVTNQDEALTQHTGVQVTGKTERWELLSKFSSKGDNYTLMHSTKAMEVRGVGCIVQSDSQVDGDFVRAMVMVRGVRIVDDENGGKKLISDA